jgi:hypothetical protein
VVDWHGQFANGGRTLSGWSARVTEFAGKSRKTLARWNQDHGWGDKKRDIRPKNPVKSRVSREDGEIGRRTRFRS